MSDDAKISRRTVLAAGFLSAAGLLTSRLAGASPAAPLCPDPTPYIRGSLSPAERDRVTVAFGADPPEADPPERFGKFDIILRKV